MSNLLTSYCQRYGDETLPFNKDSAEALLNEISDWQLSDDNKSISRCFHFKNYYQTMAFVNASAWVSHQQDHHPDLEVGYNRCNVTFSTHSIAGLSRNDFICAARLDALIESNN